MKWCILWASHFDTLETSSAASKQLPCITNRPPP